MDGSLASDFVCFVDNLRITGQGRLRVIEAGHAISTKESWLGIQDALQKLRCRHEKTWSLDGGVGLCQRGQWSSGVHLSGEVGPHEGQLQAFVGTA